MTSRRESACCKFWGKAYQAEGTAEAKAGGRTVTGTKGRWEWWGLVVEREASF
jgi:hypothetical protein